MTDDTLVPLYGFVRGDTLGVLVLVRAGDTVATLARALAQAAEVRVAPPEHPVVVAGGKRLDAQATIAGAGLSALERIDLLPECE